MDVTRTLERIAKDQVTIDMLLKFGKIADSDSSQDKWTITQLYQEGPASVGIASCTNPKAGEFPTHIHIDAIEYLICISGSILFTLDNKPLRILRPGDCASIPKNAMHTSRPLEANTAMVYVCVPRDPAFPNVK